jgi:hypothetical protein
VFDFHLLQLGNAQCLLSWWSPWSWHCALIIGWSAACVANPHSYAVAGFSVDSDPNEHVTNISHVVMQSDHNKAQPAQPGISAYSLDGQRVDLMSGVFSGSRNRRGSLASQEIEIHREEHHACSVISS